jgi:hypothetical protein
MKTYTKLWGKTISTEMVKITYDKTSTGYIIIHSIETADNTEYFCQDYLLNEELTYEIFKEIHNGVVRQNIELN